MFSITGRSVMTAPIFATDDIKSLIDRFPPDPPNGNPTLIRNFSGGDLVRSEDAQDRLNTLLRDREYRISLTDLPELLDVQEIQWLLEQSRWQIIYSKDCKHIITQKEATAIIHDLWNRSQDSFVHLGQFLDEQDLSLDSGEAMLQASDYEWDRRWDTNYMPVVSSGHHVRDFKIAVTDTMLATGAVRCSLSAKWPNIPANILGNIARSALESSAVESQGAIETSGQTVLYVPHSYLSLQQEKERKAHSELVLSFVHQLDRDGYCQVNQSAGTEDDTVPPTKMATEILDEYQRLHDHRIIKSVTHSSTLLLREDVHERTCDNMRREAELLAEKAWSERTGELPETIDNTMLDKIMASATSPTIAALLLDDGVRDKVNQAFRKRLGQMQQTAQVQFREQLRQSLWVHVQLYVSGVNSIIDSTLKNHLEEFVGDYLRHEAVPKALASIKTLNLLADRAAERDVEKLLQTVSDAKTLTATDIALSKFCRKQKIEQPDEALVGNALKSWTQQKADSMFKMKRGSDLLQNLIWLLLAERAHSLFISSGKDTTRMIKQYQSIGSGEIAKKLEGFRDALKAGQETKDDLEAMRALAAGSSGRLQQSLRKDGSGSAQNSQ